MTDRGADDILPPIRFVQPPTALSIRTTAKRKICPIALLLCGCGALVYGGMFHTAQVYVEQEREVSMPVPTLFGLGDEPSEDAGATSGDDTSGEEVDPFLSPSEKPTPPPAADIASRKVMKVTEKYWVARPAPEWLIAEDMTVGGLERAVDGQLRRTYSGKPPSLCPT